MTGDLTLSANGGTVNLHPYWDNVEGQTLGVYIIAKNTGKLNAIFLPQVGDNESDHNIHLLSDLTPVTVPQGGTGATTPAGALANLGITYGAMYISSTSIDQIGRVVKPFSEFGVSQRPTVLSFTPQNNNMTIVYAASQSTSNIVFYLYNTDGTPFTGVDTAVGWIAIMETMHVIRRNNYD